MKKLVILLLFVQCWKQILGQASQQKIDSLLSLLNDKNIHDTTRLKLTYDIAHGYLRSDPDKTMQYATDAVELAEKVHNLHLKGEALSLQGVVLKNHGDYKGALEKQIRSLKIRESRSDTTGMAIAYNDIGILYKQLRNFEKAIECYRNSNALLRAKGNKRGVSFTYGNIGTIHSELKNLDSALYYYNKALDIALEINNSNAITTQYSNIGEIYGMKKQPAKALEYFNRSLEIDKANNDEYGMILSHTNIGTSLKDLGKYREAIEHFTEAEKLCISIDAKPLLKDMYRSLADCYKQAGDANKAYEYLNKYSELNAELVNKDMTEQMAEMEARYETEKKDKELVKKDAEIKAEQAENSKKSMQRNASIVGLLLVLALAFFIYKNYRQKQRDHIEISRQKETIEEKNKEITDSIQYAKRIQRALLASENTLTTNLPEHFVFYRPKDIVSGDFYWAQNINDNFLICTADCTGHGVPGAFMSLLGISYLNEITREKHINNPAQVLDQLRKGIIENLNAAVKDGATVNDGMDMALCNFRIKQMTLDFACANNPLWMIRNGQFIEYKADKFPVGNYHGDLKPFTNHTVALQKGDLIYTLTDGFPDQFGGPKGKKFKYKTLQDLLLSMAHEPLTKQQQVLEAEFLKWKGNLEQVDDVLIIGVRV
jgi:serine phosphatase RsbU (regulator of sigma subunit)/Tfp pilus assembly protein PilF